MYISIWKSIAYQILDARMIYRKVPPVPVHVSTSPGPQSSRSRGDLEPGRPRARRRQVQDQGTDGRGRRARGARRSQGHGTRAVTVRGPLNHSTAAGGRAGNNLFPSRGCARGPAGRRIGGSARARINSRACGLRLDSTAARSTQAAAVSYPGY